MANLENSTLNTSFVLPYVRLFDLFDIEIDLLDSSSSSLLSSSSNSIRLPRFSYIRYLRNKNDLQQKIEEINKKILTFKLIKKINDPCVICHEIFPKKNILAILPCGHHYHYPCIKKWIDDNHETCPYCRDNISNRKNDFERTKTFFKLEKYIIEGKKLRKEELITKKIYCNDREKYCNNKFQKTPKLKKNYFCKR